MAATREDLTRGIVEVCHRLWARGLVAATDGNVSARLSAGSFLTTRTGVGKGLAAPADVLEVNVNGEAIGSPLAPSTELGMHLAIYAARPDVGAVVHAHPPYATAFAVAGQGMPDCVFPEVIVGLGAIPLAEYATPSTPEVAASLAPYVQSASAILLKNHGVVTYGKDLAEAYFKMEKVEHAAHILLLARLLGGESVLTAEQMQKLAAISTVAYGKALRPENACIPAAEPPAEEPRASGHDDEILSAIRQMIQKGPA
jgi:L-fuculose-phosphate aldolase